MSYVPHLPTCFTCLLALHADVPNVPECLSVRAFIAYVPYVPSFSLRALHAFIFKRTLRAFTFWRVVPALTFYVPCVPSYIYMTYLPSFLMCLHLFMCLTRLQIKQIKQINELTYDCSSLLLLNSAICQRLSDILISTKLVLFWLDWTIFGLFYFILAYSRFLRLILGCSTFYIKRWRHIRHLKNWKP